MLGRELAQRFYEDAVAPALAAEHPELHYSAGLLGPGSEVLGYDTPMSQDHDWGPRCVLLVDADHTSRRAIWTTLARRLPRDFAGFPVDFPNTHRSDPPFPLPSGGVAHRVDVLDRASLWKRYLGFEPPQPITTLDWLSTPTQKLRSVIEGALYRDDLDVARVQTRLRFFPDDVWRLAMAAVWARIGETEHLVGRAAMSSGLGWRLLAATLVRDLVHLAFLIERRYAPYPKARQGIRGTRPGTRLRPLHRAIGRRVL